MKSVQDTYLLHNGVAIPCLGFGTWQMKEGPETVAAIQKALELGYRHIDTAAYYQNERSVGHGQSRIAAFQGRSSSSRPSFGMTFILMRRLKRLLLPQWSGWDWTI